MTIKDKIREIIFEEVILQQGTDQETFLNRIWSLIKDKLEPKTKYQHELKGE